MIHEVQCESDSSCKWGRKMHIYLKNINNPVFIHSFHSFYLHSGDPNTGVTTQ
jgi:hypothetical protein